MNFFVYWKNKAGHDASQGFGRCWSRRGCVFPVFGFGSQSVCWPKVALFARPSAPQVAVLIVERTKFDFSRPRKVEPPVENSNFSGSYEWNRTAGSVPFLGARKVRTFHGGLDFRV